MKSLVLAAGLVASHPALAVPVTDPVALVTTLCGTTRFTDLRPSYAVAQLDARLFGSTILEMGAKYRASPHPLENILLHPCFGMHKPPYPAVMINEISDWGRVDGTAVVAVAYMMDGVARETTVTLEPGEDGWVVASIDYGPKSGYYWMMLAIIDRSQ